MTLNPFFCNQSDAARIERVEARLATDCAVEIQRRRPNEDVFVLPIAGGVALYTGAHSPLNKVTGLGFTDEVTESQLDEIENAYAAAGSPVQVDLSCLANPAAGATLTARGYQLVGFENVLGCRLPAPRASIEPRAITITQSDDKDLEQWLDLIVTGFLSPDTQGVPSHDSFSRGLLEQIIGDLASIDRFARFVATHDGRPAGAGSLRTTDKIAQLCGAATLPEHRRQGVQSALLNYRLAAAARAGCDLAIVTTQPGSKSQQNVQKHGFELLYTRAVLVKELGAH